MSSSFEEPINLKITIAKGCKGCGDKWIQEINNKCKKCHRCLNCCTRIDVEYSCAWQLRNNHGSSDNSRATSHLRMSNAAKERFKTSPLNKNRQQ